MSALTPKAVRLTPEMAAQLLKNNVANRPMRARYVLNLAKAMRRGEWELNGDSIRVSHSGRLLDGQHRCAAVVESGITIQTILVTGLADDVFATIDRGLGRTTSDTLSIRGETNSAVLASITRLLHIYTLSGDPYNGNPEHHPTTKQQIELLEAHPCLHDSARWIASSKWCRKYISASLAGFCHFVFTKKDAVTSKTFFAELETGIGMGAGSPVLLLRNRLTDSHSSKDKLSPKYRAGLIFKAFKLYRDGATIKYLRVRTEGDGAEKDIFVL